MLRAHPSRSAPTDGGRAHGFVLLTVMVLIFVATLMVGWGIKRTTMQSRIADLRVDDYRKHHERLGLMAVAERWMRQETSDSLRGASEGEAAAYVATLPDDTEISIHVKDGQGSLLSRVESVDPTFKDALLDALTRVPPGAGELIRSVGPVGVSLRTAPDQVLECVAGDDETAFALMTEWQDTLPESDQKLRLEINRADLDEEMISRLTHLLTVEPTLWRLLADVRDEHGSRRYEILIEFQGNQAKTHSCRMLPEQDEDTPRDRRRRTRSPHGT